MTLGVYLLSVWIWRCSCLCVSDHCGYGLQPFFDCYSYSEKSQVIRSDSGSSLRIPSVQAIR